MRSTCTKCSRKSANWWRVMTSLPPAISLNRPGREGGEGEGERERGRGRGGEGEG